jgi:hypothetical protein
MVISLLFILRMRNISEKVCKEYQNTQFMFQLFSPEKHAVNEIMWKNVVRARQTTGDNIMLRRKGVIGMPEN